MMEQTQQTAKEETVLDIVGRMYGVDPQRIEALKDVAPHHYVAKDEPINVKPHPSQNLISLYNLDKIHDSLRRFDPLTGEKINKIRKSYEGKIKALPAHLRIGGRNKAVVRPGEWEPLLTEYPDEDWFATKVNGKEPDKVRAAPEFSQKLEKALQMFPAPLPKKEEAFYKNIIGLDDIPAKAVRPGGGIPAVKQPLSTQQKPETPGSPARLARPERPGAKRRYNDTSFGGYGEGYEDDEDGTDGDERGLGRLKKKRKGFGASTPLQTAAVSTAQRG